MTIALANGLADGWAKRLLTVFKKEMRDHLRDRRSLLLALIYPLLGPALVAGGLYLAGKTLQNDPTSRTLTVPAVGLSYAPELARHLAANNIEAAPAPATQTEREAAVREGRLPLILIVPESAQGHAEFTVDIITNLGQIDNLRATARLTDAIQSYNDVLAAQRAQAAGLAENYAHAVVMHKINVARDANMAVFFYNMMPPLVIFMIFLGGVHLAIDTTVGERERGSLEPLLLAPVERGGLLLGKALAALVFTAITTGVNLAAFKMFLELAVVNSATLAEPPAASVFVGIFFVAMPLMAIAVALQMMVAVITRSMKEAQIYLGLLPLVPALPGMVLVFQPVAATDTSVLVPVFGQMTLIHQMVAEQTPSLAHLSMAATVTLVAAALIFLAAVKSFRREKMFVLG